MSGLTLKSGILLNDFRTVLLLRFSSLCLKDFLLFSFCGALPSRARIRGRFEGHVRAFSLDFKQLASMTELMLDILVSARND